MRIINFKPSMAPYQLDHDTTSALDIAATLLWGMQYDFSWLCAKYEGVFIV
jgi:hypothetical protein